MPAGSWASAGASRTGQPRPARQRLDRSVFRPSDTFNKAGSFFTGFQGGYNYLLPNRILLGAEADASFPAFPSLVQRKSVWLSVGGLIDLYFADVGAASYGETVLSFGTVRGRIGYAPGTGCFTRPADLPGPTISSRSRKSHRHTAKRPSCGGSAGRPAPASKCRLRRTGPRGSNICGPATPPPA